MFFWLLREETDAGTQHVGIHGRCKIISTSWLRRFNYLCTANLLTEGHHNLYPGTCFLLIYLRTGVSSPFMIE